MNALDTTTTTQGKIIFDHFCLKASILKPNNKTVFFTAYYVVLWFHAKQNRYNDSMNYNVRFLWEIQWCSNFSMFQYILIRFSSLIVKFPLKV